MRFLKPIMDYVFFHVSDILQATRRLTSAIPVFAGGYVGYFESK